MHSLLEELGIEHGYRELEGVGHESGRIYPFSAMVRATWPCPVPVASQALLWPEPVQLLLLLLLLVFGVRLRGVWGFRWEQVGMLFHADFFPSTKAARAKM